MILITILSSPPSNAREVRKWVRKRERPKAKIDKGQISTLATLNRATYFSYVVRAPGFVSVLSGVGGRVVSFAGSDAKSVLGTGREPAPAWRFGSWLEEGEEAGCFMLQETSTSHYCLLGKSSVCGCCGAQNSHVLGHCPCLILTILHGLRERPSTSNM